MGGGDFVEDFLDFCFGGSAGGTLELDDVEIMELGECRGDVSLKENMNMKIQINYSEPYLFIR